MKGILIRPKVWQAKFRVLEQYGEAQTRRLSGLKEINKEPDKWTYNQVCSLNELGRFTFFYDNQKPYHREMAVIVVKPRYQVGEVVYIKEAWATERHLDRLLPSEIGKAASVPLWYKADDKDKSLLIRGRWRSPLFMPAWAARYFIQITSVRPERLNQITEEDAIAEGCVADFEHVIVHDQEDYRGAYARDHYAILWDSINPKCPWASNPWVEVYRFHMQVGLLG